VRRLMRDAAPDGVGLVVLAAADLLACRGPATNVLEQRGRLAKLDAMLAHYGREAQLPEPSPPLLRGRDLIAELGLTPGPHFSEILGEVEQRHEDGEITTREEALEVVRKLVGRS
jgi:poly(A) polymerase